jgi:PEP-CTERM motif
MSRHRSRAFIRASIFAGGMVLAQAASAGAVILNHDEWTFTDYGFSLSPASTTVFAQNVASAMNADGGACNLLVYSNNFGLVGSSLNSALTGAGCSVSYSTGAFNLATLSSYDGVFLAGTQFSYSAAVLSSYVNSGHSAYIAGGTGSIANEDSIWDSFTHTIGLDFGPSYNGIQGLIPITSANPLFAGVTGLYFNNGNTVSVYADDAAGQILINLGDAGLIGMYNEPPRFEPEAVPEPATLALMVLGLAALGLGRYRTLAAMPSR